MIVGLILAGGRSSRFGQEKALADLNGRPFIAHVADALAAGCEQVAVNARAESLAAGFAARHALPCLLDAAGDPDGPLSGVKAGLLWAKSKGASFLATAPCDTPFLPRDLVGKLVRAGDGRPTVARTSDGLQPLCSLWPVGALVSLEAALSSGEHPSIKFILKEMKAVEAFFDDAAAFDNLNTPADYQSAVQRSAVTPS